MTITKPYYRTCRQLLDGSYANAGNGKYIEHPRYAVSPENYVRSFLILQKDVLNLFEFVEPSDNNLRTYSYRIHELLVRACIEVEANCKAIMKENTYGVAEKDLSMGDYWKIEKSHKLSGYEVKIPHWKGNNGTLRPFGAWAPVTNTLINLDWYTAYNQTKHNRHDLFDRATFETMLKAVCGLLVILTAQFRDEDFVSSAVLGLNGGRSVATGGYFQISPPTNWPNNERYEFNWNVLKNDTAPFNKFDYDAI